ncbi:MULTISPECIES: hypothetical protein [unclassified Marinobacterium]|uniref:hypothetical protein n=1 Tax=unclassified Marinobacterium TaxID=2644139 RepID=UPI001569E2C9|nr:MULTISPECIES: hypothetical protein [unclassified Marinobacterium]NRP48253.1 hypothetical protein [Marinobacterium sp. xm-d-543]NRQ00822.1 hypothetical protein [Marinobacterium sp. xm-d-530]
MNNRTKRIKVSLTRDSANKLDEISEEASMTPSQIINTLLINSDANDVMEKYNANKANR